MWLTWTIPWLKRLLFLPLRSYLMFGVYLSPSRLPYLDQKVQQWSTPTVRASQLLLHRRWSDQVSLSCIEPRVLYHRDRSTASARIPPLAAVTNYHAHMHGTSRLQNSGRHEENNLNDNVSYWNLSLWLWILTRICCTSTCTERYKALGLFPYVTYCIWTRTD